MNIKTVTNEAKRGCGFRKEGGFYLVADGPGKPCGKIPKELGSCPVCGGGFHPGRGLQWTDPSKIFHKGPCNLDGDGAAACPTCPLHNPPTFGGLLWIGEQYTPAEWSKEAWAQGVSRRIPAIPADRRFKVGTTWFFVASRKTFRGPCSICQGTGEKAFAQEVDLAGGREPCEKCKGSGQVDRPGIFHAFLPKALEYILTSEEKVAINGREVLGPEGIILTEWKETLARLDKMEAQGVTLVDLKRTDDLGEDVHKSAKKQKGSENDEA